VVGSKHHLATLVIEKKRLDESQRAYFEDPCKRKSPEPVSPDCRGSVSILSKVEQFPIKANTLPFHRPVMLNAVEEAFGLFPPLYGDSYGALLLCDRERYLV